MVSSRHAAASHEVVLERERGGRGSRRHAELGEDVLHVASDRALADDEGGGDLAVGPPPVASRSTSSSRAVSPWLAACPPSGISPSTRCTSRTAPSAAKRPRAASSSIVAVSSSPSARQANPTSTRPRAAPYGAPSPCQASAPRRAAMSPPAG